MEGVNDDDVDNNLYCIIRYFKAKIPAASTDDGRTDRAAELK